MVDPENQFYESGSPVYLEVIPKPNFEIDKIIINGEEQVLTSRDSWGRTMHFTEDTDIKAFFRKKPLSITPQTVYRFWSESSQSHFYTISEQEKEEIIKKYPPRVWNYEGPAFQAYPEQISDTNLVHRFYSLTNRKHFYTISDQEADKIKNNAYPEAKFVYEGKAWFANQAQVPNTTPLHRFYSGPYKVHFYTINEQKKDYIIKNYEIGRASCRERV